LPGAKLRAGLLSLQVTIAPRPLPTSVAGSEWEGMSGAVVFATDPQRGELAVGVVSTHHRPEGESALAVAPIAVIADLPAAAEWQQRLAVTGPAAWPVLPRQPGQLAPPGGPPAVAEPVGWPLAEVDDPFALEVHRPVEPDVPQPGLPMLPAYVPREHDAAIAEAAAAGASRIAVLVGGSSTGKTRACWQALEPLRGLEQAWRLWHPIDPQAALAQLSAVGPRTVVWLNEAQRYLDTPDGTGERVAAGLRELLRDQARGPVLVLATLWPQFWDQLTARPPPGDPDPHAQARELLSGRDIPVPAAFTSAQARQMQDLGDPRLAQAVAGSRDGQVTQYLAGAPDLLDRYHNAPPAARALIDAAMDARRLSMNPTLPQAFLEIAAPGYLTDSDWDLLGGDWLEQALRYTAKPSKGIRGPLAPIRSRPVPGVPASPGGGPGWQLADYLDQHGRRARRELIPPASFWTAAGSYADPADLLSLGGAARDRGLMHDAARLYKQASAHGLTSAGAHLVELLRTLHPGDQRPADWATAHVSLDDPRGVAELLDALREAGASSQVTTLLKRDPAAHASLDDSYDVAALLRALSEAGATSQVTTLADRADAHVSLDNPAGVAALLSALGEAGANSQVTTLADRAAAHVGLDDPGGVALLVSQLHIEGANSQVTTLADRAATHVSFDDPALLPMLLGELRRAGASSQVTTLLDRDPAAHVSLDNPREVANLLEALREAGASGQVTTLADRAAAHASLDDPGGMALLLGLYTAAASGQITTLADRAAAHVSLDDPAGMALLLQALNWERASRHVTPLLERNPAAHVSIDDPRGVAELLNQLVVAYRTGEVVEAEGAAAHASLDYPAGLMSLLGRQQMAKASGQITTLADRAAAHAGIDDPGGVAQLLNALAWAGATGQITTLLKRDPAGHASLDDSCDVAALLRALSEAGATSQVTTLADRAAAHVSLDNPAGVAALLSVLGEAGASAQAAGLVERLPAAGMFHLFCEQEGREEQFRFGREADGRPAKRWAWTDLD
jgi:ribosomal protein L10